MRLDIKIGEESHQFVVFNLCSQNGYSDYEGIPDRDLALDMTTVVNRVIAMEFRIECWNDLLCLAEDDCMYLTIYSSGRIILEKVPGYDPQIALPYFMQVLAASVDKGGIPL